MSRDQRTLLAQVHAWKAEEAWRFLDLLEALHAAIWAIHEDGLVELCLRALHDVPVPDDDAEGEPPPF